MPVPLSLRVVSEAGAFVTEAEPAFDKGEDANILNLHLQRKKGFVRGQRYLMVATLRIDGVHLMSSVVEAQ